MITGYEAAAMVAESNDAAETAACLREQSKRFDAMEEALAELVESVESILQDCGFVHAGKIAKAKRVLKGN
jgi:hypothetical protein